MSLVAHAPCPSCPSCSARADVLTDGHGRLIGTAFACDGCGTWWVEMREQAEISRAGQHKTVISESMENRARS